MLVKLSWLASLVVVSAAWAGQFNFTDHDGQRQFDYRWQDRQGQEQQLQFSLPLTELVNRHRRFHPLKTALLDQHIKQAWYAVMSGYSAKEAKFTIHKTSAGLSYQLQTQSAKLTEKISNELEQAKNRELDEQLAQIYYVKVQNQNNEWLIKPDHARFVDEVQGLLVPIAQALHDKFDLNDIRTVVNFILGWLQTIPYDTLESREDGRGFNPPFILLREHRGDCDSKATLLAALLRQIYPKLSIRLIFTEHHAMVGLQLTTSADDQYAIVEGARYIIADPTGPALLAFGEASSDSQRDLANNAYFSERIKFSDASFIGNTSPPSQ